VELPPGQVPVRCRSGQGQGPVRCRSEGVRNRPDGTLTTRLARTSAWTLFRGYIPLPRERVSTFAPEELRAGNPSQPGASPTAIAIAQPQKAQSFELRAALALAKLYQATTHRRSPRGARARARRIRGNAWVPRDRAGVRERAAKRVVRVPSGRSRPLL